MASEASMEAQPEPEPESEPHELCPDGWISTYGGNEFFGFLESLEPGVGEQGGGQLEVLDSTALRQRLGEHLRAEGWAMGSEADDWAEVDDIVQHYCIRRALRRAPFHDERPLPAPGAAAAGAGGSPDPIPVLVISLERRADRRQFVEAYMKTIGYELFAATDGAALDLEAEDGWRPMAGWALAPDDATLATIPGLMMRSHVPWWHSARYWTRPVSRGEMGCAVSHVRAWEAIRDRALPAAAVLEVLMIRRTFLPRFGCEAQMIISEMFVRAGQLRDRCATMAAVPAGARGAGPERVRVGRDLLGGWGLAGRSARPCRHGRRTQPRVLRCLLHVRDKPTSARTLFAVALACL